MAEVPASIMGSIQKFLDAVSKRYRIRAVYLYGSRIKGTATQWSDIDLAVVSDDFSEDLFEERLVLMHIASRIDDRIEPHPFKVERFNENDPVASEIQRHGAKLA